MFLSYLFLGLERLLPPGANPLDPHWLELQRRFPYPPGAAGLHVLPPGAGGNHLPGVYPPVSLAGDLAAREREKLERLGEFLFNYLPGYDRLRMCD